MNAMMSIRTACVAMAVLVCLPVGAEAPDRAAGEESADSRVVLYYFHGERRCNTCRSIESYAEDTLRTRFAKQLRSGALEWQVINIDEPENEHFVQDFALPSSSLVVAEIGASGVVRHEILQKVWIVVRDRDDFESYLVHALIRYLG